MAKVLKDYRPPSYASEYPWDQWLNGEQWLVTKGQDFESTIRSFSVSVRKAAAKRGMGVSVTTYVDPETHTKDENSLVIQAKPVEDEDESEEGEESYGGLTNLPSQS